MADFKSVTIDRFGLPSGQARGWPRWPEKCAVAATIFSAWATPEGITSGHGGRRLTMADSSSGGPAGGDPLIGIRLGGYVIGALLGKGAMGAVYRAMQVSLNRPVALKVMAGHIRPISVGTAA